jgi:hypothetical protein
MGQSIKKRIKKRFRKNTENKVKTRKLIQKNMEVLKSLQTPKINSYYDKK